VQGMKAMLGGDELIKLIKNKHVFIDTCILINYSKTEYGQEEYSKFFTWLKGLDAVFVISDACYFEFCRASRNREEFESRKKFITGLVDAQLPVTNKIMTIATAIGTLYAQERPNYSKSVSLQDCINASFLIGKKDILLISNDLQDYPVSLFDCHYLYPIEVRTQGKTEIHAVGFFELNVEKLKNEIKKFWL